jgi:hypothetical protein
MSRLEVSLTSYDYSAPYAGPIPHGGTSQTVGWYTISVVGAPSFTVQGTTGLYPGLFTIPNHGLANGTAVIIQPGSYSGIPDFVAGVTYYVDLTNFTGVTPPSPFNSQSTFYLSATPGGNPIVPVNPGQGAGVMETPAASSTHTIFMQPQRYGEQWTVERVIIQNSSQIKTPSCSIYRGVISPVAMIDNTANGAYNVDDLNSPLTLNAGEPIIIQFVGCDLPTAQSYVTSTVYLGGETNR